eukprot:2396693-Pyramimonas_sp.AAC.1
MRLVLTEIGLDNLRLNLIQGVCDTCRECSAWDKPGHTFMPSTALPGKFNEEGGCDLVFYKQEHNTICVRYATGIWIPDKTMTCILDAYNQSWMQFGPAKVLYSDGEGALNNDTAEAALQADGTEQRTRARGRHATTIDARNGILRHLHHVMEAELN